MKLNIAWIQARPGKDKLAAIQSLTAEYLQRLARIVPVETHELAGEAAVFRQREKASGTRALILLDSRGKQLSSEELAEFLRGHMDRGTRQLIFAIGGADGFSAESRRAADMQLSLGKMTLPHELARVVLLEQLYRAFTILKGHPYHTGH
jgi:23S rRNA (pseudouridine1915-N3)-methyltransferase